MAALRFGCSWLECPNYEPVLHIFSHIMRHSNFTSVITFSFSDIMEIFPVNVFEHILLYLNSLDRCNAIEALAYDPTMLGSHLNRRIWLAMERRVNGQVFNQLFSFRKHLVTHLDLTGIFWISSCVIMRNCEKLVNLEYLYLLGTPVTYHRRNFHSLKKLKCVAVKESESSRHVLLKRKLDDEERVTFDKVLTVVFTHDNFNSFPVVSYDWLSYIKDGATAEEVQKMLKFQYIEVFNSEFADQPSLGQLLAGANDIDVLYVQNSPVRKEAVNIEPIKNFTNLTTLHIEVTSVVGLMFLKPILLSCRKLRKLSLDVQREMFSFVHLKFASKTLQDLSVTMTSALSFNLEKFFYDLSANSNVHLRRLWLKCNEVQLETTVNLVTFMRDNPQLMCAVIICQTTHGKLADISRLLKGYKKHPHQFFECGYSSFEDVPLQYCDMPERYVRVAGHRANE